MENRILTTDRSQLKKDMLDAGIGKHQTVIDDLREGIKDLQSSAGIVNEEEMDLSQQGFNTEIMHKINALADQLSFANEEMKRLYDMIPTIQYIHETVAEGSVLITDKGIFFISASIEEFEVDGLKVFGLSTASPLFQEMSGKKKGDSFSYKEVQYKIKDVF
jgi:transcription elongation GreA/GreB family factor